MTVATLIPETKVKRRTESVRKRNGNDSSSKENYNNDSSWKRRGRYRSNSSKYGNTSILKRSIVGLYIENLFEKRIYHF